MRLKRDKINSSEAVKEYLLDAGATVVGIAPASAFDEAPAGHRATDLIPGAKSVVVFGMKMVSGNANWPALVWEDTREGRLDAWRVYDQGCFDVLNMKLEEIAMELAINFEMADYQALFFPGSTDPTLEEERSFKLFGGFDLPQPIDYKKVEALKDKLERPTRAHAPFSFRHGAVMAGLATLGANNLALHPVFGPRIRFNGVITDCEMDQYDSPLEEQVCLYDKGCRVCIENCPHNVFQEVIRVPFAGLDNAWSVMRGNCVYNSLYCGGMCLLTCPAGTGDRKMKKSVAHRYANVRALEKEGKV